MGQKLPWPNGQYAGTATSYTKQSGCRVRSPFACGIISQVEGTWALLALSQGIYLAA